MGLFKKQDLNKVNGTLYLRTAVNVAHYAVRDSIVTCSEGQVPLLKFIESEFFFDDEKDSCLKFLKKLLKCPLEMDDGSIITFKKAKIKTY